nr:isoprenylcysteine carboxylmethyltransferase family protein [Candidatus Acidoferrales bacterium]
MTDTPNTAEPAPKERPKATIKLGRLTITGPAATAVIAVMSALITMAIFYSRPAIRMLASAAIWLVMIVYWNSSVRKIRPVAKAEDAKSIARRQLLLNLAILMLFVPVPGLTRQFLAPTRAAVAAGFTVQAGSALFYFWTKRYLGRFWSSAVAIMKDHQLVRTGPYRLIRHPLYTGMLGMFFGTTIVSGQYHALIGAALGVFVYWGKIRIEERALSEAFGAEYNDYKRHSSALIPWLL